MEKGLGGLYLIRKLKIIYLFFDLCIKSLEGKIFVVYQMGKVGSATIYKSLLKSGYSVYHIHRINKKNIKHIHREYKARGVTPPDDSVGLALNLFIRIFPKKIHYIVGMRDPIARNLSSYFQNIERYGENYESIKNFKETYDHEIPFRWFKNEFEMTFGRSICSINGLKKSCKFIENEKGSIFIYKLEFGMESILNSLSKHHSIHIDESKNSNISNDKEYADSYSKVKKKISIDRNILDSIYSNDIVKKFYSDKEINDFKSRWA